MKMECAVSRDVKDGDGKVCRDVTVDWGGIEGERR